MGMVAIERVGVRFFESGLDLIEGEGDLQGALTQLIPYTPSRDQIARNETWAVMIAHIILQYKAAHLAAGESATAGKP